MRQLCVLGVVSQVAEPCPLEDQCADGGDAVDGRASLTRRVEVEAVVWDATRGIESDLEIVGQPFRLGQNRLYVDGIRNVVVQGPGKEVVGYLRVRYCQECAGSSHALPDTRPPRYRMVVSNRDTSAVVVLKSIFGM